MFLLFEGQKGMRSKTRGDANLKSLIMLTSKRILSSPPPLDPLLM
jgi:hypothetical protein